MFKLTRKPDINLHYCIREVFLQNCSYNCLFLLPLLRYSQWYNLHRSHIPMQRREMHKQSEPRMRWNAGLRRRLRRGQVRYVTSNAFVCLSFQTTCCLRPDFFIAQK